MTQDDRANLHDIGCIALSHTAVLTALFDILRRRGVLGAEDINSMLDQALLGLERSAAHGADPDLIDGARRVLGDTCRNLAGPPERDPPRR